MDSNILRDVLKLVFENNKKDTQHCHGYWTERVWRDFVFISVCRQNSIANGLLWHSRGSFKSFEELGMLG